MSAQPQLGYDAAFERALKALARRARSKREMKTLLEKDGFDQTDVEAVEKRLLELGLLDDAGYACEVVETYGQARGESREALRNRLSREEIPSEEIESAIREVLGEKSDSERALKIAQRRIRAYRRLPPVVATRRLASFLAQKGYEPDVVQRACRQTLKLEDAESAP